MIIFILSFNRQVQLHFKYSSLSLKKTIFRCPGCLPIPALTLIFLWNDAIICLLQKQCSLSKVSLLYDVFSNNLITESRFVCLALSYQTVLGALALAHDGVDGRYCGDGDDVAHAAFEVGEVDGLVQANLQGTDNLHIRCHVLYELACCIGAGEVGEDESVHILALKTGEGVLAVAQFTVKGNVYLHLTVDDA